MAHWAELDDNNIVKQVIVTANEMPNEGRDWLLATFGGRWMQTSYNTYGGQHLLGGTPLRKNYAGMGFTYDPKRDAFIPPKPTENAVLNEETCLWEIPTEE